MPIENDQFDEQAPDFTTPDAIGVLQPAVGQETLAPTGQHGVGKGIVILAVLILVGILAVVYYFSFIKAVPNSTGKPLACPAGQPNCPSSPEQKN